MHEGDLDPLAPTRSPNAAPDSEIEILPRLKPKKGPTRRASPFFGAPGRIRTSDRLIRSQVLYPAELLARLRGGQIGGVLPLGNPYQAMRDNSFRSIGASASVAASASVNHPQAWPSHPSGVPTHCREV